MTRGKVDSLQKKKIDNDASPVHCLRYNSIGYLHQSAHRMAVKQVCTMSHCQGVSLNFFSHIVGYQSLNSACLRKADASYRPRALSN